MYTDRLPLVDWNAKSRARTGCLFLLLMLASVAQSHGFHYVSEVRTLNLDFGNAGAYAGSDGVLSSPGGTYWNEITVQSFPSNSGISIQFNVPSLRDEFGQPFGRRDAEPTIFSGFHQGRETTASAPGPLSDGVRLESQLAFFGFTIRELSGNSPIDLVVYFNNPEASTVPNTIAVNQTFQPGIVKSIIPFEFPLPPGMPVFPGAEDLHYLRFRDLSPIGTTLENDMPGVIISVPQGAVANIAAIQIRGEFLFTVPEPSAVALLLPAVVLFRHQARRRRSA